MAAIREVPAKWNAQRAAAEMEIKQKWNSTDPADQERVHSLIMKVGELDDILEGGC